MRGLQTHRGMMPQCAKRWEEHLKYRPRTQQTGALDTDSNSALDEGAEVDINVGMDTQGDVEADDKGRAYAGDSPAGTRHIVDDTTNFNSTPHEDTEMNIDASADMQDDVHASDEGDHVVDNPASMRNTADDTSVLIVEDYYPSAASVMRSVPPAYSHLYDEMVEIGEGNLYYPFAGPKEWEVARWLHNSGLSKARIDEFLKLDYVGTS